MEHKGIQININEKTGKFTAEVNGKFTIKPSLDAMKKFIDKAQATPFTAFEALVASGSGEGFRQVKIVRVEKKGRYAKYAAMMSDRNEEYGELFKDTEANRALLAERAAFNADTRQIWIERRGHMESLEERLDRIYAKDFFEGTDNNTKGDRGSR